jgi:hypothetical protein
MCIINFLVSRTDQQIDQEGGRMARHFLGWRQYGSFEMQQAVNRGC